MSVESVWGKIEFERLSEGGRVVGLEEGRDGWRDGWSDGVKEGGTEVWRKG